MTTKPFYYKPKKVWLLPITNKQAGELYKDAKIWYTNNAPIGYWWEDNWDYALSNSYPNPSSFKGCQFSIQVDPPDDEESTTC